MIAPTQHEDSLYTKNESTLSDDVDTMMDCGCYSSSALSVESSDNEDVEYLTEINNISRAELKLKSTVRRFLWVLQFRLRYHIPDESVDFLIKR